MRKFCALLACSVPFLCASQETRDGHFSGGFESISQFYHKDEKINGILPQDRIGSNNFLKLDYTYRQFSAGVQFESYLPTLAGFPFLENGSKITNKYFKYSGNKFSVLVGDFYEQFGNGLVFRAWENRQIGINNALEGAQLQATPTPGISFKAVYGRQRKIFDHANSVVRGADVTFDFADMKSAENPPMTRVSAGLSVVSRYQVYTGPDDIPATVNAGAVRFDISGGSAYLNTELVVKGHDPHDVNLFDYTHGKALQVNAGITKGKLGINGIFRSLENMDFRGEREAMGILVPVNFIPALTRQHDYLTTNIYVYAAQANGETGGQVDVFYNFGGKNGADLSINYSQYQGLPNSNGFLSFGDEKYYHDFNVELKKKWSDKFNSTFGYYNIFYNKSVVEGGLYEDIKAHIAVVNSLWRYAKTKSLRWELQHLATKQDKGNWAAAVLEFGFAPKWTFSLSDLYNYGETDIHYPNVGGSYAKGGSRLSLNYGRQRAGLYCVGGVCRFVPAATGVTATFTTTFNR